LCENIYKMEKYSIFMERKELEERIKNWDVHSTLGEMVRKMNSKIPGESYS